MRLANIVVLCVALLVAGIFLTRWIYMGNTTVEINEFVILSDRLPEEFEGFKIAQISDLHDAEFGENNQKLVSVVEGINADIIVITGDIIDSRRLDVAKALSLAERLVTIAPVYYVNGNNESKVKTAYEKLKQGLIGMGVNVLENSSENIEVEGKCITIAGISDPKFDPNLYPGIPKRLVNLHLEAIPDNENFKILLAHRPEYINRYAGKADLVFSGHAHGGQFIFPLIGGILAPGQGLFPKYYGGLYKYGTTDMLVSRGLGNSSFPFRFNNKPVVVVAQLKRRKNT